MTIFSIFSIFSSEPLPVTNRLMFQTNGFVVIERNATLQATKNQWLRVIRNTLCESEWFTQNYWRYLINDGYLRMVPDKNQNFVKYELTMKSKEQLEIIRAETSKDCRKENNHFKEPLTLERFMQFIKYGRPHNIVDVCGHARDLYGCNENQLQAYMKTLIVNGDLKLQGDTFFVVEKDNTNSRQMQQSEQESTSNIANDNGIKTKQKGLKAYVSGGANR